MTPQETVEQIKQALEDKTNPDPWITIEVILIKFAKKVAEIAVEAVKE